MKIEFKAFEGKSEDLRQVREYLQRVEVLIHLIKSKYGI